MSQENNEAGLVGWIHCQRGNTIGCFLRKCLDTSITGKLLGFLVVSLLGIVLLISLNSLTLNRINKLNSTTSATNIPQYKISQHILRSLNGFKISLLHILDEEDLRQDDRSIIANQTRLAELERMILALKNGGSIQDVAKISQKALDVFSVTASSDPEINLIVNEILDEYAALQEAFNELVEFKLADSEPTENEESLDNLLDSLDDMHEVVTNLAVKINEQNNLNFAEMSLVIEKSQTKSIYIGVVVALVLSVGSVLYILLIVSPLKDITVKIKAIADDDSRQAETIEVKTLDEIGILATHLNKLIDNIYSLNTFKAVIEEEESTSEVNQRLAKLLQERFELLKAYIYEMSSSKNNMTVAFASDPADICSTDILDDGNFCRAKRTGHPVSSIQYPEICKTFPHGDRYEHHCIPMIANGKVVGVVQLLLNKNSSEAARGLFESRVDRASRYIKEATPVIEAKRFASALQETTLRDPMTDLYNRRFLETYTETLVASTLRRQTKVGILMCDMDFFKEVNDSYGHETGDIVIIKTAEVLKSCVRASDMVIRYGGEEFLILLIDIKSRDDIEELAERIRTTMESTTINHPEGALKKTISIGYSEFPSDSDGFWESIKYADVALYRAKQEGRNRVIGFTREMWDKEDY